MAGSHSTPVTMEARLLWLLAAVLALAFSSSSGEYVGLCEYLSDFSSLHSRKDGVGAAGGRVGTQHHGKGHGRPRLGAFCGLEEGYGAPVLIE